MKSAYRICKTSRAASAFTGEGARLYGGRWNSPGVAMVYTSSSLSLATLEVLAHLENSEVLKMLFSWVRIYIPEDLFEQAENNSIEENKLIFDDYDYSRSIGDAWSHSMKSCVLAVPSIITPGEYNYLINPRHSLFPKIEIEISIPFNMDPRLLR